ncbi:hypothetical protein LCGC14_2110050 [marine sediment metagenome]|uniref:Uncharacterized protein n=1 Tax=marine sediment metagenome TaxID=412755 RepID=A0A0F9E7C6_9ZZZZ
MAVHDRDFQETAGVGMCIEQFFDGLAKLLVFAASLLEKTAPLGGGLYFCRFREDGLDL